MSQYNNSNGNGRIRYADQYQDEGYDRNGPHSGQPLAPGGQGQQQYAPVAHLDLAGQSSYTLTDNGAIGGNGMGYDDHAYDDGEKSPLTAHAQPMAGGGFYPPQQQGYNNSNSYLDKDPYAASQNDLNNYMPAAGFARPGFGGRNSSYSEAPSDVEWQKRARMPTRGKTVKVPLTSEGNFIMEHPVPNPVRNAVEAKWMAMGAFR